MYEQNERQFQKDYEQTERMLETFSDIAGRNDAPSDDDWFRQKLATLKQWLADEIITKEQYDSTLKGVLEEAARR